ncbi:MAG TPA: hypothetical protein VFX16_00335 [Pseudonocardiaceae bacterium]|nr:hypothetical protein [Pseudonocardiaceae bacterium]
MSRPRPLVSNASADTAGRHYSLLVATDEHEVRAAQRLVVRDETSGDIVGT